MKITDLLGATALATSFLLAPAAYAQTAPADGPTQSEPANEAAASTGSRVDDPAASADGASTNNEVVVTGSRIRRPNLESNIPITSLGGEQFFQQGDSNVGETLNELPQLRSTFSQQNPGLGIGIAGLNLLDLRGLGTARTLVLVNGRRHVAADILNNAVSPDVNSIPNDLIERVDVVTGGNSAVYGSDAIAGVVNFVLRRNFDGVQLRGQAGVSPRGFGGNQYVSAMAGKNFNDGRGNITIHGEFANQERVFGSELPWLRQVNGFGVVDADSAGLPNGSDGFPDSIFIRDVRSASINRFGLVPISYRDNPATVANEATCGTGVGANNGAPSSVGGLPYNCTFLFTPENNLVAQTGTRYGPGVIGGITGGNGQTGREGQLLSIQPQVKRYNFNLLAHYKVSDAFEPFIEAKWNRVDAVGNNASPTGIQGTFGQFDLRERVRLDNPFLTTAQRTAIASQLLSSGCNPNLATSCQLASGAFNARSNVAGSGQGISGPLNAADIAQINAGTYRFIVARSLEDAGNRDEYFRRDTFRLVGGLRGSFNDDWNYELSANYGKFSQDVRTEGYLDRQRFMLALDAGRNPATGQIQCRAQFDPAAALAFDTGFYQTGGAGSRANAEQQARLAADIAACVPYNPFGLNNNQASVNYFTINAVTKASLRQFVANGFISGDLSQLFELPGGPIAFSIGAEYRREQGDYTDDPFVGQGNPSLAVPTQTSSNAVVIGRFNPPAFKVKEAFAEIRVPLLKDFFLADELTLNGAVRVSDYNSAAGSVGTVWTYNAGVDWAPIRDLRLRGNYGRSVRAPNLSELYFPVVPNFAPGFVDPCSVNQIGNNPNRAANCAAVLSSAQLAGLRSGAYSLPVLSGSNPDLEEEKSDSYTIGGVLQPRWIPGLALSVDYYDIKVKNVIVALGAQAIANACYDQADTNNVFCSLFQRYAGSLPGPTGELSSGEIQGNTLVQAGINFAARKRRGIDVNLAYRATFSDNVRLNTNLILTHNLQISNFENPVLPKFENRILSELGDPKDEFRWDTDLTVGPVTLGYRLRYIGKMYTSLYENFQPLPSATVGTNAPPNNLDVIDIRKYPEVFYHDLRLGIDVARNFEFYAGLDNVLDTHPPYGLSGTGTGGAGADRGTGNASIYDAFGRKVYAGVRARF